MEIRTLAYGCTNLGHFVDRATRCLTVAPGIFSIFIAFLYLHVKSVCHFTCRRIDK